MSLTKKGLALTATGAFLLSVSQAGYTLTQDYTGVNFYEGMTFYSGPDPTNGHVVFVDETTANDTSLAGLVGGNLNTTGSVYLGVDSTNITPSGRPALRLTSTRTYNYGLFVVDIAHMPGGICGVWPAFWLLGTSAEWPLAGEIDIVEGVNGQISNKMTLHTDAGVVVENSTTAFDVYTNETVSYPFSGSLVTANCDINAPNQDTNAGCLIEDNPSTASFGQAFNANGGGVFAAEWTSEAIKIWNACSASLFYFPSSSNSSSTWGTPNALFSTAANNSSALSSTHFRDMQIIFDTTFCGDWAGRVWASDPQCSVLAPTCEEYVSNNPAAFVDAYWAVKSLQVFQDGDDFEVRNGTVMRTKSKRTQK